MVPFTDQIKAGCKGFSSSLPGWFGSDILMAYFMAVSLIALFLAFACKQDSQKNKVGVFNFRMPLTWQ